MKTIALFSQPYLDNPRQYYKNIITLSNIPEGPLANYTVKINSPYLSPFKTKQQNCIFAISNHIFQTNSQQQQKCNNILITDDTPNLFSFLLEKGYTIDTSITKMILETNITFHTNNADNLLCFITYNP
jgi:hypothetical protein